MSEWPLRIALLDHGQGAAAAVSSPSETLTRSLRQLGHHVERITGTQSQPQAVGRLAAGIDAVLGARGFAVPLAHLPPTWLRLLRGRFDIAHAWSPADAMAALAWNRTVGGPTVFTSVEPVARERLSSRRLSLAMLQRAIEQSTSVVAATDDSRRALIRWLAIDAPVLDPSDGPGYERLYRELSDASRAPRLPRHSR